MVSAYGSFAVRYTILGTNQARILFTSLLEHSSESTLKAREVMNKKDYAPSTSCHKRTTHSQLHTHARSRTWSQSWTEHLSQHSQSATVFSSIKSKSNTLFCSVQKKNRNYGKQQTAQNDKEKFFCNCIKRKTPVVRLSHNWPNHQIHRYTVAHRERSRSYS